MYIVHQQVTALSRSFTRWCCISDPSSPNQPFGFLEIKCPFKHKNARHAMIQRSVAHSVTQLTKSNTPLLRTSAGPDGTDHSVTVVNTTKVLHVQFDEEYWKKLNSPNSLPIVLLLKLVVLLGSLFVIYLMCDLLLCDKQNILWGGMVSDCVREVSLAQVSLILMYVYVALMVRGQWPWGYGDVLSIIIGNNPLARCFIIISIITKSLEVV